MNLRGTLGALAGPMPSSVHEAIVELFRDGELVRALLAVRGVTAEGPPRLADTTLTNPEIRADVVLLFAGKHRLAVVVEVQRSRDAHKQWAWPLYEAAARARHKCDACVLVFATDDLVAAWARKPVSLGPTNAFRAIVIGPPDVPAITDEAEGRRFPALAILSAFAHAQGENALVTAKAAVSGIAPMRPEQQRVYLDVILRALDESVRRNLEEWMDFKNYEFKSDLALRNFAKGKAEGEAKGKAEGKAEGELMGARDALFDVIQARGFELDAAARTRIESCRDLALLRTWITRAVVTNDVQTIFTPPT